MTVLLNADSGKVFTVARKWRRIDPVLLGPPAIDERQALRTADLVSGSDVPGQIIGRSIVQVGGDASRPDAVRDVAVWRVGYRELGGVRFAELGISCQTGEIVRLTGW